MSFEIEFNGSLNDNRDLNQVTTSSSLVKNIENLVTPASWEFNGSSGTNATSLGFVDAGPYFTAGGGWGFGGGNLNIMTDAGGASDLDGSGNLGVQGVLFSSYQTWFTIGTDIIQNGPTYRLVCRISVSGGIIVTKNGDATQAPQNRIVDNNTSGFQVIDVTFTSNGALYFKADSGQANMTIDYIRIYQLGSTGVSVTPQTITDGANKTGGTPVVSTTTEQQQGKPYTPQATKIFGVEAINDQKKVSAKMQPSTNDANLDVEDQADVEASEIIETTSTTLTVNAVNADATDQISSAAVFVKDVTVKDAN